MKRDGGSWEQIFPRGAAAARRRRRKPKVYAPAAVPSPKPIWPQLPMTHPRIPGRRFLHSPGPTPIPDAVLHAMSVQPMDLGDPRVDANIAACEQGLKRLMHTSSADVFMHAAN